jgi:Na+-driven multidrug efflux pump
MVAIIYGHGRFVETTSILRVSAIFVPLLFLVLVLASAMNAVGRNKAMAVISVVRIVVVRSSTGCSLAIGSSGLGMEPLRL